MQYKKLNLIFGLSAVALLSSGCSDSNPLDTTPPMVTTLNASFTKDVGNSDATRANMIEPGDTITIDLVANEAILLPPLRLATRDKMATRDEDKFTAQSEFPTITGSGANWTYTYRVAENFGFTDVGSITLFPFRVRDIAGNLSEESVTEFTSALKSYEFFPDLDAPGLAGANNEIEIIRSAQTDETNSYSYTITFTANEEVQEPSGRLGNAEFIFERSLDSLTWTGSAKRLAIATPATEMTLSIIDLGGNLSVYRQNIVTGATSEAGTIGSDAATTLALLSGIAPFHILSEDGFGQGTSSAPFQSYPVIINWPGAGFDNSEETVQPQDSDTLNWSLGEDGVLTLTFPAETNGFAFFTTQFFDPALEPGDIDKDTPRGDIDLTDYENGQFVFEIMVPTADYGGYSGLTGKIDHVTGGFCACDQPLMTPGAPGGTPAWETVKWPLPLKVGATPTLDMSLIRTGLVLWPDRAQQHAAGNKDFVIMLRNMRFEATIE